MQVIPLSPRHWKAALDDGACWTKGNVRPKPEFFPFRDTFNQNGLSMMTLLLNDNF